MTSTKAGARRFVGNSESVQWEYYTGKDQLVSVSFELVNDGVLNLKIDDQEASIPVPAEALKHLVSMFTKADASAVEVTAVGFQDLGNAIANNTTNERR